MARIGYIVTELPEQRIEEDEQRIQKDHLQGAVQRRGENQRTEETYGQSERQG